MNFQSLRFLAPLTFLPLPKARSLLITHDNPKTNALLDKVNRAILANGINSPKAKQKHKSGTSPLVKVFRAIVVIFFLVCGGLLFLAGFLPPLTDEDDTTSINTNTNADADTNTIVSTQVPSIPIDNITVNPLNPQTVYAAIGARTRDCPSTNCNPIQVYQSEELTLLGVTQGDLLEGSTVWYQVSRNNEIFFIHEYSITFRGPTPVVPTVDWRVEEQPVYYGNDNSSNSNNNNSNFNSNNTSTRRPENCDDAVAMGLSPQQAGQWNHLDRDNDGVACYGD